MAKVTEWMYEIRYDNGMVIAEGGFWSETQAERRMIARLQCQRVWDPDWEPYEWFVKEDM